TMHQTPQRHLIMRRGEKAALEIGDERRRRQAAVAKGAEKQRRDRRRIRPLQRRHAGTHEAAPSCASTSSTVWIASPRACTRSSTAPKCAGEQPMLLGSSRTSWV